MLTGKVSWIGKKCYESKLSLENSFTSLPVLRYITMIVYGSGNCRKKVMEEKFLGMSYSIHETFLHSCSCFQSETGEP